MESSTPGFISKLKGNPIKQRYCATTISLYPSIDLTYTHLQRGLSSQEMVEAKKACEAYVVRNYHADNGRFAYNAFQQAVTQ